MDTDKWSYFPAITPDPIGKYTQPADYKHDMGGVENSGYPNDTPNTQTVTTRGFGAATKGKAHSKNSQ